MGECVCGLQEVRREYKKNDMGVNILYLYFKNNYYLYLLYVKVVSSVISPMTVSGTTSKNKHAQNK